MKYVLKHIAFPILIIGCLSAKAQLIHRELLQKTSADLSQSLIPQGKFKPFPQTPDGWKQLLPDTVIANIIRRGELALKKEFKNIPATVMLDFVRNGNRTNYEKLSFEKRNQLWDLVMAEAVEGKDRFVDQIINGIWSVSEESFWGISAHVGAQKAGPGLPDVEDPIVDLFAAETGAIMAWTDYFVGPQLDKASKLVRPRISYELNRRIFTPMLTAKYGWMGGGKPEAKLNNWAPWICSNYITAALLMEKDETKRTADLTRAIKILDQYMDGLGVDGGCEEGPSYWGAAGGCVYDALNLLYDATSGKVSIYKEPFIQKMGSYIYKTHIAGNYFINVADAHPTLQPDGLMMYRFGKDIGYQPMMEFGSWAYHSFNTEGGYEQFRRTRVLYNLAAIKACATATAKESPVPDAWYSDVQLMVSRSNNGLFVSSHGGTNGESHNHNDVGDFIVYADGYPVIIDVGSGTYTARTFGKDRYKLWFNTSAYHNLPVINGKEQGVGLQFEATGVNYQQAKNISNLTLDIAKAYPADAGLKSWTRVIKMDKTNGIEVDDTYAMEVPLNSLTQSFMSVCDVDTATPGRIAFNLPDNSKVYLDYDAAMWSVSKEKMELVSPEDQGLKHSWDGKTIWRVLLTCKTKDVAKTVKYLVHK
ncbi:heparinase II/III-family protein [Mucilaginibacter sp. HMF5004]|uniref:heparinase II/III domain-containing protein n=1 Tax=Mucilaginibacter rivuli TaxID=2857527 RepID=UPI001C5FFCA7|nr:heparinase II/III family protein [Mucilaginibacter rivuli]MBW4891333.1 heparinase II/III-family protein [Mucilaginibacter rivuli]